MFDTQNNFSGQWSTVREVSVCLSARSATSGDPFGPLTAIGVGTTLGGGYMFNRFKDNPIPPASVKEE